MLHKCKKLVDFLESFMDNVPFLRSCLGSGNSGPLALDPSKAIKQAGQRITQPGTATAEK